MADLSTPREMVQRVWEWDDKQEVWFVCPNCGENISWMFSGNKPIPITDKCHKCGQALDWSNNND